MTIKNDNQSATLRGNTLVTQDGTTILDVDSTAVRTWIDSRIGTEKPEWRSIIRQGGNATTSYSCGFQRLTPVQLSATATINDKNGPVFTKNRTLSGTPSFWRDYADFPAGLSLTSADSTARLKFLQHYRQRRTQFQGGVFLGELAKTVKMLSSPAKSLRGAIDQYVTTAKKRSRGMKKPHRVIAETWLEYAYGWKPLIHDIEDAARIATAHPFDVFEKISGRGRSTIERVLTPNLFTSSWLRVLWSLVNEGYVDVKYKGAIRATNSPPPFPEQLGLSWSNVLPTAWELIPYSFLFDYFTNIGVVIEGISTGTIHLDWGYRASMKDRTVWLKNCTFDQAYMNSIIPAGGSGHGSATMPDQKLETALSYNRTYIDNVSIGLRDFRFRCTEKPWHWLNIAGLLNLRKLRKQPK
jgi:hypothetical protein